MLLVTFSIYTLAVMESEPFYITLPSNASMDLYPDNKISHYQTKLPKIISLPQNWEVGLCELIFPANWYNVVEGGNNIIFKRKRGWIREPSRKIQFTVQKGFLTIATFLQEMEDELVRVVNTQNTDVFSQTSDGRVLIQVPPQLKKIELNDHLAHALGFKTGLLNVSTKGYRPPQKTFISNDIFEFTVETNEKDVALREDIKQEFSLPEGHYDSPDKLLDLLNTLMVSILQLPPLSKYEGFTLNKEKKKIEVKLPFDNIEITFDPPLAALLGFNQTTLTGKRVISGEFPYDVKNSFYSLFIYTDIIQSQMIGDTYAKLLQVTPAPQRTNTIISHTFNPIQYVPLERYKFDTIDIAIRNSAGDLVPFTTGLSIVKLHFRPRL